jgi:hypothetical protein
MTNMYLLLRDGRQSGPFTIGELLQQQVRPTDMIWIEGKSTAWCYLYEMQLLPGATEKISDQRIVPSTGKEDEIERKAEELRKRALAFTPQRDYAGTDGSSRPVKRQRVQNDEEVFHFVDHRKDRKSIGQEVLMSVLIIGIFAASVYGGKSYFNTKQEVVPVAHKLESVDNHAAIANPSPVVNTPEENIIQDTANLHRTDTTVAENEIRTAVVEKTKSTTPKISKKKIQDSVIKTEPPVVKNEETILPPVVNEGEDLTKKEITATEPKDTAVQVEKKKKGLRLFRKKKKDDNDTNNE